VSSITETDVLSQPDRDRLLTALAELCTERGLEEIGLSRLATRASISVDRLAEIFPGGVEECLLSAVNAMIGRSAGVAAQVERRSGLDAALLVITELLELVAHRERESYLTFVVARQGATPRVWEAYERGMSMAVLLLERLAYEAGGVQAAGRSGRAAIGGAEALVRRELVSGRAEQIARQGPVLVYAACVPLLGQEEATALARRTLELCGGANGDGRAPGV
jgi:hypothetical protein